MTSKQHWKFVRQLVVAGLVLYLVALAGRAYRTRLDIWLPDYIRWSESRPRVQDKPIHIFFFFTDHFEPATNASLVKRWVSDYPKMAARHLDSNGRPVQHTWFYPVEQPNDQYLRDLRKLVVSGYGEVELHLHHRYDNWQSALAKYERGIAYLQQFGFSKTIDGQTRFAFIHGNNSLDNSLGPRRCGVNRELEMLRRLGCFVDYTFPNTWDWSQPSLVNKIYWAVDDDGPKSYRTGHTLSQTHPFTGDLLMFTGPVMIRPTFKPNRLFFVIDDADIHPTFPASRGRVDSWVHAGVHVDGKPEWVFIKVSAHAAASEESTDNVLGPKFEDALSYMESRYNDGRNYVLHYVTAREAYNLAIAAAQNQPGNPEGYYDFVVKPYVANRTERLPALQASVASAQAPRPPHRDPRKLP